MKTRRFAALATLLLAALGCRDDAESPTEPAPPTPQADVSAAAVLRFAEVSAGDNQSCAVNVFDSRAYCWGFNLYGQLGDGTTIKRLRPVAVLGGLQFRQVSTGGSHTCGVTLGNRAYCWGMNNYGQLGIGTEGSPRLRPIAVVGGLSFRTVSAGFRHTCGVTTTNRAYCWGYNAEGGLGDGTRVGRHQPVAVLGGLQFRDVSTGDTHTCGVTTVSRAYCWGQNNDGQLGDSSTALRRLRPVRVAGTRQFRQVSLSGRHTCAVTSANRAFCWGYGTGGRLGYGGTATRRYPVAVAGGLLFSLVSAGGEHTCGVTTDSRAYCWGFNTTGQLGDGTTTSYRLTPRAVTGGLALRRIDGGANHTCAATAGGVPYCWGLNYNGQLGDGTTTNRLRPTRIAGT